ncbi:hypothetical protein [Lysobacter sp. GCM10012299]|uniref:hypothetical protein n=1 Tax=Lysobacter sp. GCM10012299 TaxID=3317333 RepID=UPI00361FAF37
MRFLKRVEMPALAPALVSGRTDMPQRTLVPKNHISVYSDESAKRALARTDNPMPIIRIVYPDKTDYLIEVDVGGQVGYVEEGHYTLESDRLLRAR